MNTYAYIFTFVNHYGYVYITIKSISARSLTWFFAFWVLLLGCDHPRDWSADWKHMTSLLHENIWHLCYIFSWPWHYLNFIGHFNVALSYRPDVGTFHLENSDIGLLQNTLNLTSSLTANQCLNQVSNIPTPNSQKTIFLSLTFCRMAVLKEWRLCVRRHAHN